MCTCMYSFLQVYLITYILIAFSVTIPMITL
jgi:hypothetical protein